MVLFKSLSYLDKDPNELNELMLVFPLILLFDAFLEIIVLFLIGFFPKLELFL